jgi:hypothetical protein
MANRDIKFYKRTLAKRLVLLQRHQLRDRAVRHFCKLIRETLDKPRSLDIMRQLSRTSGLMLRAVRLPPEAWLSPWGRSETVHNLDWGASRLRDL